MKESEIEHQLRKQTKNMKPVDAMIFRDHYFKQLQEKEKGKQSPTLRMYLW
jgi:hypothetical protein